jgi:hypothetical protein
MLNQPSSNASDDYRQSCQSAAEEFIDALLSEYWGDTFDSEKLIEVLVEAALPYVQTAVPLTVTREVEAA